MATLHKNIFLSCLSSILLLTSASYADDTTPLPPIEIPPQDEHVSVGARPMDPAKRELMLEKRTSETQEEANSCQKEPSGDFRRAANIVVQKNARNFSFAPRASITQKPKITLATYYPVNCHTLMSIAMGSDSIEFEDGSHWQIASSDAFKLNGWFPGDQLVVTPNSFWFSSYDYYITNKRTGNYVKAELFIGPLQFGAYSHWIVGIDYYSGHVFLENGTTWCVAFRDNYLFRDWAINDHIILGINDSWMSNYDNILINVNVDSFIRAKQY